MRQFLTLGALLIIVASMGAVPAARSQGTLGILVVVNAANPAPALRRDQASGMFLGKVQRWPNGQDVLPVDQIDRSPARAAFARQVLGKSPDAVKFYWQELIFSGRATPPPERVSDIEVLTYVRSNAGAIGYVLPDTDLGGGVKTIPVTP
jgi:ABC-type phosphate transport system substrate-binding protein